MTVTYVANRTVPPRFEPVAIQNKLAFPAIAASTASDITRELPSPRRVAAAGSSEVAELAYQERLVLTELVLQVGGVQVMD